jgi:hypothetical protein
MIPSGAQLANIVRVLRPVVPASRIARVRSYLHSILPPPSAPLDHFFAEQKLDLPRNVRRVDRRGRAAKVIAERRERLHKMLNGEVAA